MWKFKISAGCYIYYVHIYVKFLVLPSCGPCPYHLANVATIMTTDNLKAESLLYVR